MRKEDGARDSDPEWKEVCPDGGQEPGEHGEYCQLGWDLRSGEVGGVWARVLGKRASGGLGPLRRKGGESWWNVIHTVGA